MNIETVGVLGAGTMGAGIAQVAAAAGYQVVLSDLEQAILDQAIDRLDGRMKNRIERGKMEEAERQQVLDAIETSPDRQTLRKADVVIEAIIEKPEAKEEAFADLDQICDDEVILASNTSSISITAIAAATGRPERVAGMHFFNPAQVMKLVEVVHGFETSDETVQTLMQLAESFGKVPVEVKKDSPGFIVNRILLPQLVAAFELLDEGVAEPEDIDQAVKLGLNYPMGPFELADLTGNDVNYHVMEYLRDELGQSYFNPPQILKQLIRSGRLGRKAGEGVYPYEA